MTLRADLSASVQSGGMNLADGHEEANNFPQNSLVIEVLDFGKKKRILLQALWMEV